MTGRKGGSGGPLLRSCRSPRGQRRAGQSRDATGNEARAQNRSRGRSVVELYNTIRPHSSLGYIPPTPETVLPYAAGLLYPSTRSANLGDLNRRNSNLAGGPP